MDLLRVFIVLIEHHRCEELKKQRRMGKGPIHRAGCRSVGLGARVQKCGALKRVNGGSLNHLKQV